MNDEQARFAAFVERHFQDCLEFRGLETRLKELGLDSLELLEFVMGLEGEFNTEIDLARVNESMTLSQVCEAVLGGPAPG
jgi:acyl carrier protein